MSKIIRETITKKARHQCVRCMCGISYWYPKGDTVKCDCGAELIVETIDDVTSCRAIVPDDYPLDKMPFDSPVEYSRYSKY